MESDQKKKRGKHRLQMAYDVLLTLGVPLCAAYIALAVFCSRAVDSMWLWAAFMVLAAGYWLAVFCLGLANIVQSFGKYREGDASFCVNAMLVLKYGLVVFFVVNFVVILLGFLLVGLAALVGSRGTIIFAIPLWLPVLAAAVVFWVAFTWLVMLPGSFYGIQVIRFSRREGKLSGRMSAVHGILQFLFLTDVLDALYLAVRKWGMGKKSSVVIGGLYVFVVAAMAAGIVYLRMVLNVPAAP